uniref:ribonuclease H n=1 Tax=Leptobrachium leishanense TaxID=445787 RepID=A0A8C5MBC8_9ANUR
MVRFNIGGKDVEFMIDTGAEHSVVTQPMAPLSGRSLTIVGASGQPMTRPVLAPRNCTLGGHQVHHSFLYVPECPVQLMGRDLLMKLQAQITFHPDIGASLLFHAPLTAFPPQKASVTGILALIMPREEEWRTLTEETGVTPLPPQLHAPGVWAEDNPPGMARNIPPVLVELKSGANPVSIRQYHIPQKAKANIQTHLARLLEHGILKFCVSAWNTPLLPVQKAGTQEYRPVQDLRAVNNAVVSVHPVVPNPYNLLALIPASTTHYTVLDLKDAFFCIHLASESQALFAFQWEDARTGRKRQLTWTRQPQGFKNSPTLFSTALA